LPSQRQNQLKLALCSRKQIQLKILKHQTQDQSQVTLSQHHSLIDLARINLSHPHLRIHPKKATPQTQAEKNRRNLKVYRIRRFHKWNLFFLSNHKRAQVKAQKTHPKLSFPVFFFSLNLTDINPMKMKKDCA
jgi:hypothetical protein